MYQRHQPRVCNKSAEDLRCEIEMYRRVLYRFPHLPQKGIDIFGGPSQAAGKDRHDRGVQAVEKVGHLEMTHPLVLLNPGPRIAWNWQFLLNNVDEAGFGKPLFVLHWSEHFTAEFRARIDVQMRKSFEGSPTDAVVDGLQHGGPILELNVPSRAHGVEGRFHEPEVVLEAMQCHAEMEVVKFLCVLPLLLGINDLKAAVCGHGLGLDGTDINGKNVCGWVLNSEVNRPDSSSGTDV